MRAPPMGGRAISVLWALLLVGLCWCDEGLLNDRSAAVVGTVECVDCTQEKVESAQAFSGLYVAIDCKAGTGKFQTRGVGELDKDGKFQVKVPNELLSDDGELKEECFAQLHSASHDPCPAQNGLEPSKIVSKSKDNQKHTFVTVGKLSFKPATCTSKLSASLFKHFPKIYKKPLPPVQRPPIYKKPFPPSIPIPKFPPIYKKPFPPIYKKPFPPPITEFPPIYKKPFPPTYNKPFPPPITELPLIYKKPFPPIYKKPFPPTIPEFPPIYKKPFPPIYKKPFSPPIPEFPPMDEKPFVHLPHVYKKKPLPYLPKFPPVYKKKPFTPVYKKKPLPPIPKLPPKYPPYTGGFPPLPPYTGGFPPLPPYSP